MQQHRIAYYWAFVDPRQPILQGQQANQDGRVRNDMEFRPALSEFRQQWEQFTGGLSRPADGFLVIHELRILLKRLTYPDSLRSAYQQAITAICKTLRQPIQYAGTGRWTVFEKPTTYANLSDRTVTVPGTDPKDVCLVITAELWQTFQTMSLWVEALCIYEWCLFTERILQPQSVSRGDVYTLLTARPDNRRPLSWESNNIDLLLMEGNEFVCP